jgi:GT2 family glycosyltransferase
MKVAVLILNWNGKADLLECLGSVSSVDLEGWDAHIVVVDNGSTDGSQESIRTRFPEAVLIQNPSNLGFAEGNNRALDWVRDQAIDFVIFLNNDTTVEPESFRLMLEEARRPGVGAVMPLIRHHGSDEVWCAGLRMIEPLGRIQPVTVPPASEPYTTDLFTACCVAIPVAVLEDVGEFDPRYFLYLEDSDLALRMRRRGYEIRVEPRAVISHKVSRSSGGSVSPEVLYYCVRNNLLFIRDWSAGLRRAVGYAYVSALSAKIMLNPFLRRLPRKVDTIAAVGQAWHDFIRGRLGQRT